MAETFYEILGVHPKSSREVMARAWKIAARTNHPDRWSHLGPEEERSATLRMAAINEAFQLLSDPVTRRQYDLEHGLIPALCSRCGAPGALRNALGGLTIAYCDACIVANPFTR